MIFSVLLSVLTAATPQPGQRSHPVSIAYGAPLQASPMRRPRWSQRFPLSTTTEFPSFARDEGTLIAAHGALTAFDATSGNVRWTQADLDAPIAAREGHLVATTRSGKTVALNDGGKRLWMRSLCGIALPTNYITTQSHLLTLCPDRIVYSKWDGTSNVTQTFDATLQTFMPSSTIQYNGSAVASVQVPFSGAWSGTNGVFVDVSRGRILAKVLEGRFVSDGERMNVISEDTFGFLRRNVYAPVQIATLDPRAATVSQATTFAPDPQRNAVGDDVKQSTGTAYAAGPYLYAAIGPSLYRYLMHSPTKSPAELIASLSGTVAFGHNGAFANVIDENGRSSFVYISGLSTNARAHRISMKSSAGLFVRTYDGAGDFDLVVLGSSSEIDVASLAQGKVIFSTAACPQDPTLLLPSRHGVAIVCRSFNELVLLGFPR